MRTKLFAATAAIALVGLTGVSPAHAATTTEVITEAEIVRQAHGSYPTNEWVLYTRDGGTGTFRAGPGDPAAGSGSLELSTTLPNDKAYLFNYEHIGTPLASLDEIAYATYQSAAANPVQVASINVEADVNGSAAGGFTTLVFEPVYNTDQGLVANGIWQDWDAINGGAGKWWSTKDIPGVCAFDCFVSWDSIVAANSAAVVGGGVGVNQGGGNPGLVSSVDYLTFDDVTYDFELFRDLDGDGIPDTDPPTDKDQCKKDGWKSFNNPSFKNQGDCVSYVAAKK